MRPRTARMVVTLAVIVIPLMQSACARPAASSAPVEARLRAALAPKIKEIADHLKDGPKVARIAAVKVSGPVDKPDGGELGVSRAIVEELKANKIEVESPAHFSLVATYWAADVASPSNPGAVQLGLVIELRLWETDKEGGHPVGSRRRVDIAGGLDVAVPMLVVGFNGEGVKTADDLDKKAREAIDRGLKTVKAADGTVRVGASSPFGLAVVADGKVREVDEAGGVLVASLPGDRPFSIRLRNDADFEVAVTLLLDGIDAFAFATGAAPPSHFLIPPRQILDVPGWYVSKERADRFLVTALPKAAASELGRLNASRLRTISATFQAAVETGKDLPPGEPTSPLGDATDYGIGRGEPVPMASQVVKRVLGFPRAIIPLRYRAEVAK